jgi:hypothetical protein
VVINQTPGKQTKIAENVPAFWGVARIVAHGYRAWFNEEADGDRGDGAFMPSTDTGGRAAMNRRNWNTFEGTTVGYVALFWFREWHVPVTG